MVVDPQDRSRPVAVPEIAPPQPPPRSVKLDLTVHRHVAPVRQRERYFNEKFTGTKVLPSYPDVLIRTSTRLASGQTYRPGGILEG